jgi:hypothetical protein
MDTQTDPRTAILTILAEEASIHERLHEVALSQQTALLEDDPDTLLVLVREMAAMTERVEHLEEARVAQVARLTGDPAGAVPISALLPWFDDSDRDRLSGLRTALLDSLQRVRITNAENALLARRLLSVSDQCLRTLGGGEPPVYTAAGATTSPALVVRAWSA